MNCLHGDGELRAFIEITRTERGWEAAAYLPGRDCVPEFVCQHYDPIKVATTAAHEIADHAWEIDEIDREEAA